MTWKSVEGITACIRELEDVLFFFFVWSGVWSPLRAGKVNLFFCRFTRFFIISCLNLYHKPWFSVSLDLVFHILPEESADMIKSLHNPMSNFVHFQFHLSISVTFWPISPHMTNWFSHFKMVFSQFAYISWLFFIPLLKKQISALWSFSIICLIMQLIPYREDSLSSFFDRCINTMVTNLCKSCHFQRAERRCCNNILVRSQYEHIDADIPLSYNCVHILE